MTIVIITIISIIFVLIKLYLKSIYDYWKKKGISFVKPYAVFGSTKELFFSRISYADFYKRLYDEHPDQPFVGLYVGMDPTLLIRDPDLIRNVLSKDFHMFTDRGILYNQEDFLSDNLLFMKGDKWKLLRKNMTYIFTSGKIKTMYPLIQESGREFQTFISKLIKNNHMYELRELMEDFTTTVIGTTGFGVDLDVLNNRDCVFRQMGRNAFAPNFGNVWRLALSELCPTLFRLLKVKKFGDSENYFLDLIRNVIKNRMDTNTTRNDFIEVLVELKKKGILKSEYGEVPDVTVTDELLAAQAFFFFIAGFEATAITMSFALYELSLNPQMQEKCYDEIYDLLKQSNGQLTHECIESAKYLDKIVDETLRKYPILGSIDRVCQRTYEMESGDHKVTLPRLMKVTIPVYGIHHDPLYYKNPSEFDPERFSSSRFQDLHPFAYIPFGGGPRICIAARFAKVLVKVGILTVMQKFRVKETSKTPKSIKIIKGSILTKADGGLWVEFEHRT